MQYPPPAEEVITADSRVPNPTGPFTAGFPAYRASKIFTLNAIDGFVERHKPHFDVVNVMPGFVFGWNKMATDTASLLTGTNRLLLYMLTGVKFDAPRLAGAAHIDDVAKVYALALGDKIKGNRDLGVTTPMVYDDAWGIVEKHFPDAVSDRTLKKGEQPSLPASWDASATEEHFGFQFKT